MQLRLLQANKRNQKFSKRLEALTAAVKDFQDAGAAILATNNRLNEKIDNVRRLQTLLEGPLEGTRRTQRRQWSEQCAKDLSSVREDVLRGQQMLASFLTQRAAITKENESAKLEREDLTQEFNKVAVDATDIKDRFSDIVLDLVILRKESLQEQAQGGP